MNANQLNSKLTWAEVDGQLENDCRRIIRDERFALTAAIQTGDTQQIEQAMIEARRVCEMWGLEL